MPPKRRQQKPDSDSDYESDVVVAHRPTETTPFELLEKIEAFKERRDNQRKNIADDFDVYFNEQQEAISKYYASKAENRSAQVKALLSRLHEALGQRASIERSIQALLSQTSEDTEDLVVLLEAVQTGRRQKLEAACGSLASIVPKGTAIAAALTPPSDTNKRTLNVPDITLNDGRTHNVNDVKENKRLKEASGKDDPFGGFSW
ncbi:hypothetical protein F4678DRAFT_448198 [Xylaria arbuscula]|nr:hypothetical protein F4678DRAFT_448198 [Xylaria arbuscula]